MSGAGAKVAPPLSWREYKGCRTQQEQMQRQEKPILDSSGNSGSTRQQESQQYPIVLLA
jgi:hypothetical protein